MNSEHSEEINKCNIILGWQMSELLRYSANYYKINTYGTLPVKLIPPRYDEAVIVSPKTGPSAGTKFTTPGGTPASRQILNIFQFESKAVSLGFHITALP